MFMAPCFAVPCSTTVTFQIQQAFFEHLPCMHTVEHCAVWPSWQVQAVELNEPWPWPVWTPGLCTPTALPLGTSSLLLWASAHSSLS